MWHYAVFERFYFDSECCLLDDSDIEDVAECALDWCDSFQARGYLSSSNKLLIYKHAEGCGLVLAWRIWNRDGNIRVDTYNSDCVSPAERAFMQYALRKYTLRDPGRVYGVEISRDEEKVLLLNNATLPEVGRCVLTSVREHLAGTNSGSEFQLEITKCGTTGWIVYWNGAEISVLQEWLNGITLDKGERAYLVSVLSEYISVKHNRLPLYSYEPSALAHLLKTYQHKALVNSGQKGKVIGAKGDETPSDAEQMPGYYEVILIVEDEDSGKWLYRNVDEVVPTFDEEKS